MSKLLQNLMHSTKNQKKEDIDFLYIKNNTLQIKKYSKK